MDEKLGGDEGYKDGCWTPIREGSSLVSRQSGEREEGGWDQYSSISRESLWCLSQWQRTFVMPVCCHGNISRASGQECLFAVTDQHRPVEGGTLLWGMWWGKARSQSTFNLRWEETQLTVYITPQFCLKWIQFNACQYYNTFEQFHCHAAPVPGCCNFKTRFYANSTLLCDSWFVNRFNCHIIIVIKLDSYLMLSGHSSP